MSKINFIKNISKAPYGIVIAFCLILLLTNILVQWQISFWHMTVTLGLFIYPLTFFVTNYVNEIYGKPVCNRLVFIGFLFAIVPSLILSTFQITLGSLLAYLVAQFHDVWAYDWWKKKTHGRLLWLRNNASTLVSEILDTLVFTSVAFYGVLDNHVILSIMYSEYPIKAGYAIIQTLPLYYFVRLAKRQSNNT